MWRSITGSFVQLWERREKLKSPLMRVKEESEKGDLNLNIKKPKIMESSSITSWETMETVTDFILGGSKITVDGDSSYEIKRHLILGRKAIANLDSVLKRRDITLLTKVHIVKAVVSPVVMYPCENWTILQTEPWRIDAFNCGAGEDLRIRWTARRSSQSILKEISPEYSLKGLVLKLQYSGHLMQRVDLLEKTLML